jgi:hypothetical protein
MIVLGLDPGVAHGAWALVGPHGELVEFEHYETEPVHEVGGEYIRLARILRKLRAPLAHAGAVAIERPTGGFGGNGKRCPACKQPRGNAKAAAQLASAAASALGLAVGLGGRRKILAPAPVTWRSKLGAKRGRDAELHAALLARYPILADLRKGAQPHVLDAVGLALYGRLALRLDARRVAA